MSKKACKDKEFRMVVEPRYKCKKCGAEVVKEKHVCKPVRL